MYINTHDSDIFQLKEIVAIYESTKNTYNYAEHGEVTGENITWKPIEYADFFKLIKRQVRQFLLNKKPMGKVVMLPKNVLHFSFEFNEMVFYTPPGKRMLYFTFSKTPLMIPLPGLLFHVKQRDIIVYAFKKRGTPTEDTILYHHPLPNGDCMGNVKRKGIDFNKGPRWLKQHVEQLYFDSKFTSEHVFDAVKDFEDMKCTAEKYYKDLAKMDKFPNERLKKPQKPFRYEYS